MSASSAFINDEIYFKNIESLITEKYKRIKGLPEKQYLNILSQLYWVQENKRFTPQADALYDKKNNWATHLNREILRALCRIEMLLLLREVNEANCSELYEEFTAEQCIGDRLQIESFRELARQMQQLNTTQVNAQIYASVIASLTLSPKAIEQANQRLGNNWPYDSVQFSGRTVRKAGDLYPIYSAATEDERLVIQHCFPDDQRHWRHAFFLENLICLDPIKEQLSKCDSLGYRQSVEIECNNWLTYWLINALGFEGHVKSMQGSHFMTESVFQRAILLNENIQLFLNKPELDILSEYSQACLKKLELNVHNQMLAIFITKLANMTNIFNKKSVTEIYTHIKDQNLLDFCKLDHRIFSDLKKIATYVPGFLQNIYRKAPEEKKIASIVMAMHWANTVIENAEYAITSFMNMNEELCGMLIDNNFAVNISLNQKGEVDNITSMSQLSEKPVLSAVMRRT